MVFRGLSSLVFPHFSQRLQPLRLRAPRVGPDDASGQAPCWARRGRSLSASTAREPHPFKVPLSGSCEAQRFKFFWFKSTCRFSRSKAEKGLDDTLLHAAIASFHTACPAPIRKQPGRTHVLVVWLNSAGLLPRLEPCLASKIDRSLAHKVLKNRSRPQVKLLILMGNNTPTKSLLWKPSANLRL